MNENESSAAQQDDGVLVPEHFVPTPRTVSPQAQAFLRSKLSVDLPPVPASRADAAGWRIYREEADRRKIMASERYATLYPAEIVDHRLSESVLYEVIPQDLAPENAQRAILYIHGGAYAFGGGEAAVYPAMHLAGRAKARVFSIDYRLLPEFCFPVPLDDTVEGYRFLLDTYEASNIALYGSAAGANLVAACTLKSRDQGLPLPAACALHSGPYDLSEIGDSSFTNVEVDIVVKHSVPELPRHYTAGHNLKDPHISPVYGDFSKGFPPSILTSGTRDLLLSDTVRLHRALVRAGVEAELHVWEAMTHAVFVNAPEEDEFYEQNIRFMLGHMTGN